jgi:hypothetical protein
MTVKFKLDHPKDKEGKLKLTPVSILVEVYHKGPIAELASGERIVPKFWDSKRQEAKSHMTGHTEMNLHLQQIKNSLTQLWRDNKGATGEVLKGLVRQVIKGELDQPSQKKTIIEAVQQLIAQYEKEKDPSTVNR